MPVNPKECRKHALVVALLPFPRLLLERLTPPIYPIRLLRHHADQYRIAANSER